jgi:hypothetical protein
VVRSKSWLHLGDLRFRLAERGRDPADLSDEALVRLMDHLRAGGTPVELLVEFAVEAVLLSPRPPWVGNLTETP